MSKLIEEAKRISELVNGEKSELTADPKRIIKEAALRKNGVIVEIPWNAEVNGKFMKTNTIVITRVTKEKIYFCNPAKVAEKNSVITEADKEGSAREIGKDNTESMLLTDFFKMARTGIVIGIVSPAA